MHCALVIYPPPFSVAEIVYANCSTSGVRMPCGKHDCPSNCHPFVDHFKISCKQIVPWTCSRHHHYTQPCDTITGLCHKCYIEDRESETKRQQERAVDIERETKKKDYMWRLAELQRELERLKSERREKLEEQEQEKILRKYRDEIERFKNPAKTPAKNTNKAPTKAKSEEQSSVRRNSPAPPQQPVIIKYEDTTPKPSTAKDDWEWQKTYLDAQCPEIDTIMGFIGLESVKAKF